MGERNEGELSCYLEWLPNLPMEVICEKLSLVDVVDMSLVSSRVHTRIQDAHLKITRLEVSFDSEESYILLTMDRKSMRWSFTVPRNLTPNTRRQFGRLNYSCVKTPNGFYTNHYDIEHGIPRVLTYLVSLFDCSQSQISLLSIDLSVVADFRSVIETFRHFTKIQRLVLTRSGTNDLDLTIGRNVHALLNNWQVSEAYVAVNAEVTSECGFFAKRPPMQRFEKLLRMEHLYLEFAEWLTPEDFLAMSVKTAVLVNHRLTEKDLNAFIKQWLASTDNKLMWLEVKSRFVLSDVIEGLTVSNSDKARGILRCPHHCSPRGDIIPIAFSEFPKKIRRADGIEATIAVTDLKFFFHVKDDGVYTPPERPEVAVARLFANRQNAARMQNRNAVPRPRNRQRARNNEIPMDEVAEQLERDVADLFEADLLR